MNIITESSSRIKQPDDLRITLYEYQKALVWAMAKCENERCLDVKGVYSSAGFLTDPVGSGKTLVCIALMLHNRKIKIHPQFAKIKGYNVIRKFRTIFRPTLIIVGINVINQWITAIKQYTNLTMFVVKNVFDLRILLNKGLLHDHDFVNSFDVLQW